jgi:hypothetical protein
MIRRTSCLLLLVIVGLIGSCKKDKEPSGRELIGTWVDVNHRSDSLVIYREQNGIVLFDNSMAYRAHPRATEIQNAYKWYVRLKTGEIGVSSYNPDLQGKDYFYHSFQWIEQGEKFEVESLTFRPYISCLGCLIRFEKLR